MTKFRTVTRNGRKRVIPMQGPQRSNRTLTAKELADMQRVGIRHPGSLTSLGYHVNEDPAKKHAALDKAVAKYGRKETLRKLGELYRLDYNRPALRAKIVGDIRYASGGARSD